MKKTNRILSMLLAVIMVVCMLPISVSAVQVGDTFYDTASGLYFGIRDISNNYVAVYPNQNDADNNLYRGTNYVIPDKVTYENVEYTVIEIYENAFDACSNIESVSIPNTVSRIGGNAFINCVNLTSVNIPDSVTYIGYAAFYACGNVTSFVIPESVTVIQNEAFLYCYNADITVLYDGAKELVTPFGSDSYEEPKSVTHKLGMPDSVSCESVFGGIWNCSVQNNIDLATGYNVYFYANGHQVGEKNIDKNDGTLTSFNATEILEELGPGKYTVYAQAKGSGYVDSDLCKGTTFTYGTDSTAPTVSDIAAERTEDYLGALKFTSSEKGTLVWNYANKYLDTTATGKAVVAGENSVMIELNSADACDIQFVVKDYMGNVSAEQAATVPKMVHSHSGTVTMIYDTEWSGEKAFTDIRENMNIVLTDDVKFTNTLQISNSVTVNICLNGHTLNMQNFALITMSGNVHICDCSANKTGRIIGDRSNPTVANTGATVTLDGISVTNEGGAAVMNNTGTLNVINGSVITTKDEDAEGIYARAGTVAGTVNVTDSEIVSYGMFGVLNSNNSTFIAKNSTITGGIDSEDIVAYGVFNDGGTVTLENTSVIAEGEAVIAINNTSEGTFTLKDSIVTHNGGGKYTILHYGGDLSIYGTEIHSKSQPITVSQGAQVYLYNDTEITTTFSADIYLRGTAAITAHKKGDTATVYTGDPIVLTYDGSYAANGSIVVYGSTDTTTFSVYNTNYQLAADSGNLKLLCDHSANTNQLTCLHSVNCSVCGDSLGTAAHKYTEQKHNDTHHWYECSVCNEEQPDSRKEHHSGTATCTAKAKCEVCGTEYGEMLEHSFTVPQSDDTDHWNKCKDCDAIDTKIKHSGGAATCTEKAKCEVCGTEYGEANGHGETEICNAKTDSCNEEGYTGDKHCKVCGEKLETGTAIAKTDHTYENGKCTVCGATDPDYVPTTPEAPTSPKTDDNRNLSLWLALFFVSGGVLTATAYGKKRKIK